MMQKKKVDDDFKKIIDKLVVEKAKWLVDNDLGSDPMSEVPDCVWHRTWCGCKECISKLQRS